MIKKALISVWDKEGLLELAEFLIKNEIEIVSTGGTANHLVENGIPVTKISKITGMDSVMDGRVKTLNPKIFGGILADRDILKVVLGPSVISIEHCIVSLWRSPLM